ncbi:DUF2334 domain-containing protein [candidate division KSB1 bacterium]|nr:DUF2334 domain-containing protein [candidate division KSB1 bacterium]
MYKSWIMMINWLLFAVLPIFAQNPLIFIVRVDDILCRNTTILPRSIKPFETMVESKGAKVTWAVIPHRLVEEANRNGLLRQELLQSMQKGHEISQHGYNHICPVCGSSNHEMYCSSRKITISYAEQETLLGRGSEILLDSLNLVPASFVPPGHSADQTTYTLLADKNFHVLSTTTTTKSFIRPGLYNLSPHGEFTWALKADTYDAKLAQVLHDIRNRGDVDGYYCLLLHDYFIRQGYENGIVIRWVGEMLDSLNTTYGSNIQYLTLSQAALHFTNLSHLTNSPQMDRGTFILHQNYPNPFNNRTTIIYELLRPDFVELILYNAVGQQLDVLYSGSQSAGVHRFPFHSYGLASGIYFYQIRMGDEIRTRRCLLSR